LRVGHRCDNPAMTATDPRHRDADLAELTAHVRAFAADRGWEPFHTPKNLAMALSGEVGELLAELQWLTPEESAAVMDDGHLGPRVRAEIGDVMIYLVRLADVLGLDLVAAARDKLAEAASRYPPDKAGPAGRPPPAPVVRRAARGPRGHRDPSSAQLARRGGRRRSGGRGAATGGPGGHAVP
jgi:NTP pyrophosphatase (non-canonical NTP hydrolase)